MVYNRFTKTTFLKMNIFLFLMAALAQCNSGASNKRYIDRDYVNKKVKEISKDFRSYYNYRYYNIKLSGDFTGLDSTFTAIDNASFLRLLSTGEFMPVKIDTVPTYVLFKMPNDTRPEIIRDIEYFTEKTLFYRGMEGRPMPAFNFRDINGDPYNNAFFEGKIVVIKCWYQRIP